MIAFKFMVFGILAVVFSQANAKNDQEIPRTKIWVDDKSRTIRDKHGRHLLLHGVNVVYKIAPYIPLQDELHPQDSLSQKDIDDLVTWGFNWVRLGVMWDSVEVERGVYNHTYLDEVDKLINKLGEHGIYTMVDAHQDVGARAICGEGFPNFYANDVISAKSTPGYDSPTCLHDSLDWMVKGLFPGSGLCKSIKDYNHQLDSDGNPLISDC